MSINLVDQNGNKTGEVSREQFIHDYIDAKRAKDVEKAETRAKEQMKEEAEAESKRLNHHTSSVERKHIGDTTANSLMNGIVKMLNEANCTYTQETMKSVIVYMDGKKYEIKITEKRK